MDAALLHLVFRRLYRSGRPLFKAFDGQFGFGHEPVIEVMPVDKPTFHVPIIGGFTNHVLALLRANDTSQARFGVLSNWGTCSFCHICSFLDWLKKCDRLSQYPHRRTQDNA
jgi:hypothetical protein